MLETSTTQKNPEYSDLGPEDLAARDAIKRAWTPRERLTRWCAYPGFNVPPWVEFGDNMPAGPGKRDYDEPEDEED